MHFTKSLTVLAFALSASAVSIPHGRGDALQHRAIAARGNATAPAAPPAGARRKRALTRRCQALSSSGLTSSTAAPSSSAPAPPPENAAPPPPAPSSKPQPTPTPTPAPQPAPTTQAPPPPPATTAASSSGPSFLQNPQTGQGTWYDDGLGACGITNTDSDFIVAVSHLIFDAFPGYNGVNPNTNPVCNKQIQAHYQGNSVTVTVTDRCVGCAESDLDFSPAAFSQLADQSVGRISGMTWDWLD